MNGRSELSANGSDQPEPLTDIDSILNYTLFALMMSTGVFTLVGNVLTLLAIVSTPGLIGTSTNRYILNLSIADGIVGVSACVWAFHYLGFSRHVFHRQEYMCLGGYVLVDVSCSESIVTLLLMAVDRYVFVAKPFLYSRVVTERFIRGILAGSWVLSHAHGLTLAAVFSRFDPNAGCKFGRVLQNHFGVRALWLGPFVPMAIVTVACYARIACIARRQRRAIAAGVQLAHVSQQQQQTVEPELGEQHNNHSCHRRRDSATLSTGTSMDRNTADRHKSIGMFVLVNSLYFLSWTPFFVFNNMVVALPFVSKRYVGEFVLFVAISNSGMNFVVYACKNRQLACAYKRLLGSCCRCGQH